MDNNTSPTEFDEPCVKKNEELKQEQIIKNKEEYIKKVKDESVHMICRQSDLSYDEAKLELEKYNYNYLDVLNNYHNIKDTKQNNNKSINQNIYCEIRNLMDTGSKNFRLSQEREEMLKKI